MPLVKLHYSVEGDTTVIATLSANIGKLEFILRGLPGQPDGTERIMAVKGAERTLILNPLPNTGFKVLRVERTDGSEITDLDSKPPETVYVVGVMEKEN